MIEKTNPFNVLPCLDSADMAAARQRALNLSRGVASALGRSAVEAACQGYYIDETGMKVDWRDSVAAACAAKRSLPPDAPLPAVEHRPSTETHIQVRNETTLKASLRLVERGLRPLALNFANGKNPGGGFRCGALAQEEVLCRSSALYQTLVGDPMYAAHRKQQQPESSDWAIYSPDVPVFRRDNGTALQQPWLLSVLSCAAPFAPFVGQPAAGDLLQQRILRILAIAHAFRHTVLVLGAWGCGAFKNDPQRTAIDFRQALANDFRGVFSTVVFAIADGSPDRRFLGPFREAFAITDRRTETIPMVDRTGIGVMENTVYLVPGRGNSLKDLGERMTALGFDVCGREISPPFSTLNFAEQIQTDLPPASRRNLASGLCLYLKNDDTAKTVAAYAANLTAFGLSGKERPMALRILPWCASGRGRCAWRCPLRSVV